jgi:hypothetical protein
MKEGAKEGWTWKKAGRHDKGTCNVTKEGSVWDLLFKFLLLQTRRKLKKKEKEEYISFFF